MIAYKWLVLGAVSPFTGFRWPAPGEWVRAPEARDDAWVYACRRRDLPYWLEDELWSIELAEPIREARYQIASSRARLVARITAWDLDAVRAEYARACALRARDVALPHLSPALREALAALEDLARIAAIARNAEPADRIAAYLADAAEYALDPAIASYIACMLASSLGGGLAAFEVERTWQARWLADRLGLEAGNTKGPEH